MDFSRAQGDLTLVPSELLTSLQQSLGAQLAQLAAAGRLPAGYSLSVPVSSTTETFAGGPQLAPSGKKTDWTKFYGVGGGVDFNLTKHFALRVQADFVRDHLFDDLLKDSRNTVRFSIGPGGPVRRQRA